MKILADSKLLDSEQYFEILPQIRETEIWLSDNHVFERLGFKLGFLKIFANSLQENAINDILRKMTWIRLATRAALSDMNKLTIVEIGCGASACHSYDPRLQPIYYDKFQPWLCRAFAALGSSTVGIDKRPVNWEPYRHLKTDLMIEPFPRDIPSSSVDVVCGFRLSDDPVLTKIESNTWQKLQRRIEADIKRILKPNGLFITDDDDCVLEDERISASTLCQTTA